MAELTINVEQLSKRYRLGVSRRPSDIGDVVQQRLKQFLAFEWLRRTKHEQASFWALRNVSFQVKAGEVVGLIGRNGAGKSTLLKILSRITFPTEGRATLHGRVGSLLEVGTGFHHELSGRDNIFLSGALLGMKKAEIARKFDEIVAFAEVDRFIDTPVKHYSSGMFVRLAFAVAAHLEPEILIMDEVLAVGDSRFQKKCLSKMEEVGHHGRTVIFVSHSMPAVARLCQRVLLLDQGSLAQDGPSHQVISSYMSADSGSSAAREWTDDKTAPQGEVVRLLAVRVRTEDGEVADAHDIRSTFRVEMEYEVKRSGEVLQPFFRFMNEENVCLFTIPDNDPLWRRKPRPAGRYVTTAWLPRNLFAEGRVFVDVALCLSHGTVVQFIESNAVSFQIIDTTDGDSARGDWSGPLEGVVRPMLKWTTTYIPSAVRSRAVLTSGGPI